MEAIHSSQCSRGDQKELFNETDYNEGEITIFHCLHNQRLQKWAEGTTILTKYGDKYYLTEHKFTVGKKRSIPETVWKTTGFYATNPVPFFPMFHHWKKKFY